MALETYNDYVRRFASGYYSHEPIWGEVASATTGILSGVNISYQRAGNFKVYPSYPSGVTGYIPAFINLICHTTGTHGILGKLTDMGSLDIAGPTFTDGSAMPTVTELGNSTQIASSLLVEVTTTLNATPGNITVTYVDQDNNSAETTTSTALTASAAAGSFSMVKLNSPDWGVLDVTSATRTGGTTPTGVLKFWGMQPLCAVSFVQNYPDVIDLIGIGSNPMVLTNGESLTLLVGATAARNVFGSIVTIGDE